MATVPESPHSTVIVISSTGREVHRFSGRIPLRQALAEYADILGIEVTDETIKKTPFGYRMSVPEGDFRSTYRRNEEAK